MRQRRRKSRGGFTLIEVMIALVVSLVGLLGALGLTVSIMNGGTFARYMTEASTLAQSKIEAINSQVITLTNPTDGTVQTERTLDAYGSVVATGQYTRTTTWGTVGSGTSQRRSILVTVSWLDGANITHSVSATEERIP